LGDLAAGINREALEPDTLAELRNNLLFSARFFDSYLQSKLHGRTFDDYENQAFSVWMGNKFF
jgi:hypothetical protein